MKTFAIAFITVVVVAGVLVGIGAMRGYIEFGLKDDVAAIENTESPDVIVPITDNDNSDDFLIQDQSPQETACWSPSTAMNWIPGFIEIPFPESDEIDIGYGESSPPYAVIPDDPVAIPDPPEAIENPDQPESIELPPVRICD